MFEINRQIGSEKGSIGEGFFRGALLTSLSLCLFALPAGAKTLQIDFSVPTNGTPSPETLSLELAADTSGGGFNPGMQLLSANVAVDDSLSFAYFADNGGRAVGTGVLPRPCDVTNDIAFGVLNLRSGSFGLSTFVIEQGHTLLVDSTNPTSTSPPRRSGSGAETAPCAVPLPNGGVILKKSPAGRALARRIA